MCSISLPILNQFLCVVSSGPCCQKLLSCWNIKENDKSCPSGWLWKAWREGIWWSEFRAIPLPRGWKEPVNWAQNGTVLTGAKDEPKTRPLARCGNYEGAEAALCPVVSTSQYIYSDPHSLHTSLTGWKRQSSNNKSVKTPWWPVS